MPEGFAPADPPRARGAPGSSETSSREFRPCLGRTTVRIGWSLPGEYLINNRHSV